MRISFEMDHETWAWGYHTAFAELGLEPETGRFWPFDALLAGPTVRSWRSRTRRPCGKSAVDSDVVDAMGGHPVDARSRVRFELGLCEVAERSIIRRQAAPQGSKPR